MRKNDFLEILKDYLKNSFSQEEIMDILRDYEEYFIDGEIEGKSDIEIISSLGSPKEIANELLAQGNKTNNSNKIDNKIEALYIDIKSKFKTFINKSKVDLRDENHIESREKAKQIQNILNISIGVTKVIANIGLIVFGLGLVGSIVLPILFAPAIVQFLSTIPQLKVSAIFGIVAYIGLEILLWQLFIAVIRLVKKAKIIYSNWLETNQLYIQGSIKKEEIDKDGGLLDEEK